MGPIAWDHICLNCFYSLTIRAQCSHAAIATAASSSDACQEGQGRETTPCVIRFSRAQAVVERNDDSAPGGASSYDGRVRV